MESDAIRLYTVREAAAVLKVHERTVLRWVKSGRLAARRIGRQIRIDQDALRTCGEPVAVPKRQGEGPPKGSPEAVLRCAGILSKADADALRRAIREADDEDWEEVLGIPPGHEHV
jgi:excisionase family DNA binding protein